MSMDTSPVVISMPQTLPSTPRNAQHWEGSSYILPADERERFRLNVQHNMIKKAFGNKLVQAPIDLQTLKYVLESGTGTGIWLTELANEVPASTTLQGIDIETSMFPKTVPPNISVSKASITRLPTDWSNHFDLIHQRFLVHALRKPEWIAAVAEMYRALRPGGWVNLTEPGEVLKGTPSMSGAQGKLVDLSQRLIIQSGMIVNCASHLPILLEQAGFINVSVEKRYFPLGKCSGHVGVNHFLALSEGFRGVKESVLRGGGFGIVSSGEEFDKLIDDAEKEWNTIPGTGRDYYVIIAQKPKAAH